MAKLQLKREVLGQALERANLKADEQRQIQQMIAGVKGSLHIDPATVPMAYLRALLDDARLSANQRAVVSMQVHGMSGRVPNRDEIYDTTVTSPIEFGSTFTALGTKQPNVEIFLNGRWYPVIANVEFIESEKNVSKWVLLQVQMSIGDHCETTRHWIYPELFFDEAGKPDEKTVLDVLQQLGYRRMQTTAGDFNLKLVRAERAARDSGRMVVVKTPVLARSNNWWWSRMEPKALGTPELPRKAVVESELEVAEDNRDYYSPYGHRTTATSRLPFVRIFSLDLKQYVFVDVDDLEDYEFSNEAMSRLHLPEEMLNVLTRVFDTSVDDLFGDIIEGKHGGVVILASGNPGVGKTLTAEVYAEHTQRPLYVLELGELGTNVEQVEENLSRVFTRVARWNAVLQFDECEIFLTERGEDLERSAIVGIFLRLLDYYQGILFLTTNRPDVLDHAVMSRVMLKLDYPDLDLPSRHAIWQTMFESAGMELIEGDLTDLAEADINGRQIRNLTRLAKILYPSGKVRLSEMVNVLKYGCTPASARRPQVPVDQVNNQADGVANSPW